MTFTLDNVVPWGRSYEEYVRMFALTESDLRRSILGCADGPAAFNAQLTQRGGQIVSCDPLYAFSAEEIQARIAASFTQVIDQTRKNVDNFVWSQEIPDVDALGRVRMEAMELFLGDLAAGRKSERYVTAELPQLPFADGQFDLALCSHFLFLYDTLGPEFHQAAIQELCRVAREVRIFPLLQLDGTQPKFLPGIIRQLKSMRLDAEVVPVAYHFQRGAKEMLRINGG